MNQKHKTHNIQNTNNKREYFKFVLVLAAVFTFAGLITPMRNFSVITYIQNFTAVFFIVFAGFKFIHLREFAYGFQSYDLLAAKSLAYSYAYPFMQLTFGALYLYGTESPLLDATVLAVSLISGAGVLRTLGSGAQVHCVCLGSVIKLPLSVISFIEDFGMAVMAFVMLLS